MNQCPAENRGIAGISHQILVDGHPWVGGYPLTMGHMAYVDSNFSNFHKCLSDIKINLRCPVFTSSGYYIYMYTYSVYLLSGFSSKRKLEPFSLGPRAHASRSMVWVT